MFGASLRENKNKNQKSKFCLHRSCLGSDETYILREGVNAKKNVFFRALPKWWGGGGLPMPEFFGPLSISAFLVNKKSLFLQKCQCIELLTVFRLHIYSILYSIYSSFSSKLTFKS